MEVVTDHDRPTTKTVRRTTDGGNKVPVVIDLTQVALPTAENRQRSLPNTDRVLEFPPYREHVERKRTGNRNPYVGSLGCRPVDYPRLIEMVRIGKIQVKPMVTHRFKLEDINQAFETLRKGESLRSIVVM